MKSFLVLLVLVASTVQAFVASPAGSGRQESSTLFAEGKFGFRSYVSGQDVNRADCKDTWFPADKPLYKPTGRGGEGKVSLWVPYAKDVYGHAKYIQTEEELRIQCGDEMTRPEPKKPKGSKSAKLTNGEFDMLKRYPRWINSC